MKLFRFIYLALALSFLASCDRPSLTDEIRLQEDIDHLRLDHLEYWTAVIEEYQDKQGNYPLQDAAIASTKFGHVQLLPDHSKDLLVNWGENFEEYSTTDLVAELEKGLGRKIARKLPPEETVPTYALAYNYFVEEDGYLFWVSCQSCGITEISTYTMDGKSATVNIASEKMVPKVTKALSREDMLAHPRYKIWRSIKLHDKKRARALEARAAKEDMGLR